MSVLQLELLGDFRMRSESGSLINISAKKSQAMLAYLGVKPAQLVSRDKMAALLWSSTATEQARQSLRQTLSSLRKELAQISPDRKILVEDGVRFTVPENIDETGWSHIAFRREDGFRWYRDQRCRWVP